MPVNFLLSGPGILKINERLKAGVNTRNLTKTQREKIVLVYENVHWFYGGGYSLLPLFFNIAVIWEWLYLGWIKNKLLNQQILIEKVTDSTKMRILRWN